MVIGGLAAASLVPSSSYGKEGFSGGVEPTEISSLDAGRIGRAEEMSANGNYTGALDQLRTIDAENLGDIERQNLLFMLAETAYRRGDSDCIEFLERFVQTYPASQRTLDARLMAADYYFFQHDYAAALERYGDIDFSSIDASRRPEYDYRKALSLTKRGYFTEARPLFDSLLSSARFSNAAKYYIAYLDYVAGDYDSAYRGFESVEPVNGKTASRRGVVRDYVSDGLEPGYYMTQIEFRRGQYNDVISHGRSLLSKRPVEELIPETERVIGESYFKLGDKDMAKQYLERYVERDPDSAESTALYALGTIYYDDGDTGRASALFDRLTNDQNELAQSAWLYLGQCLVRDGDETGAAMAFDRAYKLNYNREVTESAMYNYGTSLLRGGTVPFRSSAGILEKFLEQYPRSEHASEVRGILGAAYCRQGEYSKALGYLDGISHPDADMLRLRQQVLFQIGVEEVSNGRYADAEKHLMEASGLSKYDRALGLQSYLWLGDAYYSQKNYGRASQSYESFLKGGESTPNYALGLYNLGYALYYQDKFSQAVPYFARAASAVSLSAGQRANARLRRADCLFYSRSYSDAKKAYTEVISANDPGADYATLRRATIMGLEGDISGKLRELETLKKRYPSTSWGAAALLERASTLAEQGRVAEAETTYQELTDSYPAREETRRGLVSLGRTYLRQGKRAEAIEAFRRVIEEWPTSEEARSANEELTVIYASVGNLQDYSEWLGGIPGAPRLASDEVERLEYEAAEDAFNERSDISMLERYVRAYPDGSYLSGALYAIAEGRCDAGKYSEALEAVNELLSKRPDASQVNEALLLKGNILEEKVNTGAGRAEAYETYLRLLNGGNKNFEADALAGMMRLSDKPEERLALSRRIISSGAGSALMDEASYYGSVAQNALGNSTDGVAGLKRLAANPDSRYGAMAAVALGTWQLENRQYKNAEKTLTAFTESGTPHEYWLAKGFIALADVYSAQGKKSLAKEYLMSLKENYPGDEEEIMEEIEKRLR